MEKTIEISTDETKGIKDFVEAVKELDIVECVYLLPYSNKDSLRVIISVVTVYNSDLLYNPDSDYKAFRERVAEQLEMLSTALYGYQNEYAQGRLAFELEDSDNYSLALMNHREIMAERELVSGTIIFDRNERFTRNKNSAVQYIPPYTNVLKIENPEVLTKSDISLD